MTADVHKAVVLARGLGTRMRRRSASATMSADQAKVAETGVKALIPVGRPFLDYVISALADADLTDVCLVVGPEHDAIREHYDRVSPNRVAIRFAVQETPAGTADAVLSAQAFAGTDPFLVLNSDNYYPVRAYAALRALTGPGLPGFTARALVADGFIPAARLAAFALLDVGPDRRLRRIVEKPDAATAAAFGDVPMISMNCWRFGPRIFEACRAVRPSTRGELELPQAVQLAIERFDEPFEVVPIDGSVLDLSHQDDIGLVADALAGVSVRL